MREGDFELLAVGPIDGRYHEKTEVLQDHLSEFALIKARVGIEVAWLTHLAQDEIIEGFGPLEPDTVGALWQLAEEFDLEDAHEVKAIEAKERHDVKSVEYWLRGKLGEIPEMEDHLELIHIGLTSEDVNNLSYALMLRGVRDGVLIPNYREISNKLFDMSVKTAGKQMPAHTHGQDASPTTLGKETRVFRERIQRRTRQLGSVAILGKLNGATGNYSALTFAYPDVDWPIVAQSFVESLGVEFNPVTTQIEPHDWIAELCHRTIEANSVMLDMARDYWHYIHLDYLTQQVNEDETGSSIMPNKVNPIDLENAEGNIGTANALLSHLAQKLTVSRLQRDLSDSTALRALGEAFGHTVIAQSTLLRGLGKVHPNPEKMLEELEGEYAVLTVAVQTVMRKHGIPNSYDVVKAYSRGKHMSREDYIKLVDSIEGLPAEEKVRLMKLTPREYIGRARDLALLHNEKEPS